MFLLIYRLTRNSPAPPLYPLTFLVQRSSSGTDAISLPPAVYLASPSQPLAVLVQRSISSCTVSLQPAAQHQLLLSLTLQLSVSSDAVASGTDTISLPQAVYLASPSQLLAVFVQLSSSGTGTNCSPPDSSLSRIDIIASRFPYMSSDPVALLPLSLYQKRHCNNQWLLPTIRKFGGVRRAWRAISFCVL